LKSLNRRHKSHLVFVAADLLFVAPDLVFVALNLVSVAEDLVFVVHRWRTFEPLPQPRRRPADGPRFT
jgi:hypothetical protein